VLTRVDPTRFEALKVDVLNLIRGRLQNHLELVVFEQAVRVFPEATICRPPRRLNICHVPMTRTEDAQEGLGVHRAGADFDVERLLDEAPLRGPVFRELEDQVLQCHSIAFRKPPSNLRPST
jgi:hypothetical protein